MKNLADTYAQKGLKLEESLGKIKKASAEAAKLPIADVPVKGLSESISDLIKGTKATEADQKALAKILKEAENPEQAIKLLKKILLQKVNTSLQMHCNL